MLNEQSGILVSDGPTPRPAGAATIPGLLLHSVSQLRKPDAFRFKRNSRWFDVSTEEFLLRVEELFFALRTLGVQAGDRVAILSENRLEWAVADYAAQSAGAVVVPIYPTLSARQVEALLVSCEPALLFASTIELLKLVMSISGYRSIRYLVAFESGADHPEVMRLDTLYEIGRQAAYAYPNEFRRAALAVSADDVATIIYTSGTTGVPKGAMLTHRNIVSNVMATSERLPIRADDATLSFLPLAHIFQRHVDYAGMHGGATIAYGESVLTVANDMLDVRPTFAAGVPRFFEKVYGRVMAEVSRGSLITRAIFEKALSAGIEHLRTGQASLAYKAADRVVFRHVRARLGGRIRLFISGGAALQQEIAEFFWAIGLPIYEGYGLTETSPVITLNGPGDMRFGTVGRTVGNQEIRIEEDGEILVRGSSVMKGYYRADHETAQALADGWFHTGDVGEVDADGFLKITDRKKDLIVTSSGKNIAPQPIENRLKLVPFFENVVLVGDHRNFVSALIVPNYAALSEYGHLHHIAFDNARELLQKPEIYDLAMKEIAKRTKDLSGFEKIRKIAFLDGEFSIEGGELTPTLKIRRSFIEKKYKSAIDQLYTS
jgi:long-chain acyl-CoA synthetase